MPEYLVEWTIYGEQRVNAPSADDAIIHVIGMSKAELVNGAATWLDEEGLLAVAV